MDDNILVKHMEEDASFQEETRHVHQEQAIFKAETEGTLADIHSKIDNLATKEDIAEIMNFMKNVQVGLGVFRFSWNNAGKLGAFCMLIVGVYLLFKIGIVGAIMWLTKFTP